MSLLRFLGLGGEEKGALRESQGETATVRKIAARLERALINFMLDVHREQGYVETLLGRAPKTRWKVAVRCPHGTPAVIENEPLDLRGKPFPTRFWLVCRALSAAVARLEAAGGVK